MRVLLCILVVVTHILTQYTINLDPDDNQLQVLYWIRNILIVATPDFIILSVMLTTLNYKTQLPKGYLRQRIKYLLMPYILIGLFYSFSEATQMDRPLLNEFISNVLLGNWYGYFILVIMQFIILNKIIYKIKPDLFKSKIPVFISMIITFGYLYSYYNIEAVRQFIDTYYPLGSSTVIFGWLFFYFFGTYIGAHYGRIKNSIQSHSALLILFMIIAFTVFILLNDGDYWTVTSFHYSLMLYHTAGFLMILYAAIQLDGYAESLVNMISKFSLFIFMLHPIILPYIYNYTSIYQSSTIIFMVLTLLLVFGMCIGVGMILSQINIFKFVLGKQPYKDN